MVSRVHGFELGVQGTWFREYGVLGFESMVYISFEGTGVQVCSLSLPILFIQITADNAHTWSFFIYDLDFR